MPPAKVKDAIEDIRKGKLVILVDDEDRENEGDLCFAAEHVTPEKINFMAMHGRGLICLSMTDERLQQLDIPLMVQKNTSRFETAFAVSIDAKTGITTGISAYDRARTVRLAVESQTKPADFVRPGHIFPLRCKPGGVLVRTGQTEGSVDLARLAGLMPAAVICEIMKDDGTMARMPDLEKMAQEHDLKIVTIADIIAYRLQKESLVEKVAEATIPTPFGGEFRGIVFRSRVDHTDHLAMVKGEFTPEEDVLVRMHSECLTGDVFFSLRCDCGQQLIRAMEMIGEEGKGALIYMHQEGRGIGLVNKIKAYALQEKGKDTVEANEALGFKADLRDYGIGAQILTHLGIRKLRLMTNNPKKIIGLEGYGLEVVEQVPIIVQPNSRNLAYLKAKQEKMGHLLHLEP
ncbi:MAG: bifunctional 3,4-dihydroxy-2-butanone-4-phosphate synthase/GTP cyclohydrolase II [bacterium]